MPRGVFIVESMPSSADRLDEYNDWYDRVHLPQVLATDGFVSARRFAPLDGNGPYVTVYELEADDLDAALGRFRAASARGEIDRSDALQTDPPPRVRLLVQTTDASAP